MNAIQYTKVIISCAKLTIPILCLFAGTALTALDITLDYEPKASGFGASYCQMTSKGTLLINDETSVFEFSQSGQEISRFELEDNFIVANFAYLTKPGYYAVCAKQRDAYKWQIFIYTDEGGKPVGRAYDGKKGVSDNIYYTQMISHWSDKLYLNIWNWGNLHESNPPMLQEANLVKKSEGVFFFVTRGQAFSPALGQTMAYQTDFRNKWVARNYLEDTTLVFGELDGLAVEYGEMERSVYEWQDDYDMDLLPNREPHREFFQGGSGPDFDKWVYSFTKVTGVFEMETDYVISYTRPNPAYKAYHKMTSGVPAQPGAPHFVLCLLRVDENLNPINLKEIPGAFMVGVHDGVPHVLRLEKPGNRRIVSAISDL